MDYKIISKEELPKEEPLVTDRTILYKLLKDLEFNKAICITCNSWADQKDKRTMVSALSTQLRKNEGFKLVASKFDEPLNDKQRERYEKSATKGTFKRTCYLYIWKEPVE